MNTTKLMPVGRINRRDKPDEIEDEQVLSRTNLMVIGSKNKFTRKLSGSDRLNSTAVGSKGINHAFRYYTKLNFRKSFFFSSGTLYNIDDSGNVTTTLAVFNPAANPCSETMRVSAVDIQYFSDGYNGIYSYDGNSGPTFIKENNVDINPVYMISWLDRMWAFEEDSDDLHFSVNQNPTDFTDSTDAGILTISPKRGSKLVSIGILNETLYLFKQDGIYVINGRTPDTFSIHEVVSFMGSAARFSLQNVETGFIFLASDYEFYSFQGSLESLKLLTYDLCVSGDLTKNLLPLINRDRMDQVRSTYHNKIYRCSFNANDSTNIYNDTEYCFNTINETDFLTLDNNVGCYMKYDRTPDKQELLTGRSDTGLMMYQYRGLNWDNQSSDPNMPILWQSKFFGSGGPNNARLRRIWINLTTLSAQQLAVYFFQDCRIAYADSTSDNFDTIGEERSLGFLYINVISQSQITSRIVPKHAFSKGQTFSFVLKESIKDRDLAFSSFDIEAIAKNPKRSKKVGV